MAKQALLTSRFIRKLRHFTPLSDEELRALYTLEACPKSLGPHTDLIRQGEPHREVTILCEGWAICEKTLRNGKRRILNFLLPGDLIGLASPFLTTADYTVSTSDAATMAVLSPDQLLNVFRTHPRLGFTRCWPFAQEEALVAEHLVNIGRRDAYTRLGHLFLELYWRLDSVGLVRHQAYAIPLSQEALVDALGLSPVHLNRTLQRLRQDGFVRFSQSRIVMCHRRALERAVDFEAGYLHLTGIPVWLRHYLSRTGAEHAHPTVENEADDDDWI